MECTVYNPQKVRLETLEVEFTEENTTWFYNRGNGSKLAVDRIREKKKAVKVVKSTASDSSAGSFSPIAEKL